MSKISEIYKVKEIPAEGPTLIKIETSAHCAFNAFRELELFFFVTFTSFSEALLFCSCCFRESGMMKTESGISSVVASFVSLAASRAAASAASRASFSFRSLSISHFSSHSDSPD